MPIFTIICIAYKFSRCQNPIGWTLQVFLLLGLLSESEKGKSYRTLRTLCVTSLE